ncbi:uncharacterized protein LOC129809985 [Phlebotomus papatasi]|nr:uncharacterized protein LOC129809985 [Phlebotomus papatasi]
MESEENAEICKSTGSTVNPEEVHESIKVEAQENIDDTPKVISPIPENLNGNQNGMEQISQVGNMTEKAEKVEVQQEVDKDSFGKNRENDEENTNLPVKSTYNVQSAQSTHDFNIQVIRSVKEYPCLYDRANEDFNNPGKKDEAWNSIADKLKKNVNECRERYESLFRRFAETHVMLENPNVLEQGLLKEKFIHYEDMLFAKAAIDMEECSKAFVESPNQEKSTGEKRLREDEEELSFQTNSKFQKLESVQFTFDEPGCKKKDFKFTMQLIHAAKQCPSIYKNCPSYSSKAQREDWANIARKLNKSVKKCRMAYDSLYQKFTNNYIAMICPEIRAPRKSFPYYKHMRFLEPYLPIEKVKQKVIKSLGLKPEYQQNYFEMQNIYDTGPVLLNTFQPNSEMQGDSQSVQIPESSSQNAASDALIDKSEDSQHKNENTDMENVNTEKSEVGSKKLPTIRVISAASEKSENVPMERADFNVQLIRNVKEYPCIWDQAHPHFGNFTVQYQAWCEISKRIGSIPQECHQTFIALYAKFAQIYTKLKDSELDKKDFPRDEFPYYEEMMFLNYQQRIQELKFNPNFNYPRPVRYPLIYSHINAQTKQPRRLMRSHQRQLQYSIDNRPNSTMTQQSSVNQQIETTLQTFQLKLNDITATLDEKTKTTEATKPKETSDAIETTEPTETSETIKTTDDTTQAWAMDTQNQEQNTEQSEHPVTQENQMETEKNEAMDATVSTENNKNSKNNEEELEDSDADPVDIALRTEFLTDHEFNKQLIKTVKEYPCIYGKGYLVNFPNKFHAWVKIAEKLKRKRDECQKIFESLSLKFAQTHAMRQDQELVRRGFPKQPFPYYKDLMYLKDFLSMDDAKKQVELMTRPPPVHHRFGQPKFDLTNQQNAFFPQQQHPNPINPAPGPPKSKFFGPNQQTAFSPQQQYTNPINPASRPPKPQFFGPNPANLAAWNQFLQQPPGNFQQPAAFSHTATKDSFINIQNNLHIDFFFMCLCQQVKRTNMSDKDFVELQIAVMNALSNTVSKRKN